MEKVQLTCIGCPLGCPLTVEMEGKEVKSVTGNTCPNGEAYARKEMTNPTRIVTSSVRVRGGILNVVSVKTASDIPKGKIFDCMRALGDVDISAPVTIGQVVLQNIAGTGVDVVATKYVSAKYGISDSFVIQSPQKGIPSAVIFLRIKDSNPQECCGTGRAICIFSAKKEKGKP